MGNRVGFVQPGQRSLCVLLAVVCFSVSSSPSFAQSAQSSGVASASALPTGTPDDGKTDGGVIQAGCAACSSGVLGLRLPGEAPAAGCGSCGDGCGGCCYAGHKPCDCCADSDTLAGRLFGGIYQCICCPDPCYEPHWNVLADSAFFQDGARPVTQMRFRGDFGWNLALPDRSEYFWARADGNGKGPKPPVAGVGERRLNYQEGSLYTEGAIDRIGVFVELPYRHISPDLFGSASGLADMNVGTKTIILDCELILLSFQFKTFIPTGNFTRGLGTGHASLEPALLMSLKLTPTTYLQAEAAYWFAVGGDAAYQGDVFHYHVSLNHLLCHCGHDVQVVGTFELNGYEFTTGDFTDPATGTPLHSRGAGDILNIGPGIRLNICDKFDAGIGTSFAVTNEHLSEEFIRAEFRVRF